MRLCTAFVVVSLISTPTAHALDNEISRRSLRGLKGVQVIVESQKPEVEQNGLMTGAIQTDVELKLRQAGIPVSDRGDAGLIVGVSVLTSSDGLWPFMITVELDQTTALSRDPSIFLPAVPTWDVRVFGHVGKQNVRSLRDSVKDLVDQFINAYLTVNPKK